MECKILLDELKKKQVNIINNKVKLNDFIENLLGIINPDKYKQNNITKDDIKLISKEEYISIDKCIELLKKTTKMVGKELLKDVNKQVFIMDKNKVLRINLYEFQGNFITILYINDVMYLKGKEIGLLLGYKNPQKALRQNVKNINKKTYKELIEINQSIQNYINEDPQTIFIDKDGLRSFVLKSKKTIAIDLCKSLNIDVNIKFLYKEQEIIYYVKRYLTNTNEKYTEQYKIKKYFIDLYINSLNIALEIDENNHKDRDKEYETDREDYIKKKLNCKFIRFNPDDPDFCVTDVLAKISNIKAEIILETKII
jgi:very-short-patch-repair endonuclease